MSLKARFRVAIIALSATLVLIMSVLYLRGFLDAAFDRTLRIAESMAGEVQAAAASRIDSRAAIEAQKPGSPSDPTELVLRVVDADVGIHDILRRTGQNWPEILAVYIADASGRIRASSLASQVGGAAPRLLTFRQWKNEGLVAKILHVFWRREDTEAVQPIGFDGREVLSIHVVISSVFLVNNLWPEIEGIMGVFVGTLLVATALAIVLPSVVLDPLERLKKRLDLMAAGSYAAGVEPVREVAEFAAVHSKLNVLGQQVEGARQDVTNLKSNVEHLLQQLQEAVLVFDSDGRVMMAGKSCRQLLGRSPEGLTGRTISEIFPPLTPMGALMRQAQEKGDPVRDRLVTISEGGTDYHVIASIEPVAGQEPDKQRGSHEDLGILVTFRDAKAHGEIEEQLDIAERLTALSQLTRGVAHEIKNPLNAITLHLEILKARVGLDEGPEIAVIATEIARLNRIVRTFLDFHRPVDLHLRRLNVNDLVCDLASMMEPDAISRGVEVLCSPSPAPLWVDGDRDLLQQAILNVVTNAIEAMPEGGEVRISSSRDGAFCRIDISDTGPGIPPDLLDKIFNLYFTTKDGGSGIGLALSYRFIQLLNGKMSVTSEPGRGATFSFEFPEAVSDSVSQPDQYSRGHRA